MNSSAIFPYINLQIFMGNLANRLSYFTNSGYLLVDHQITIYRNKQSLIINNIRIK